VVPHLALNYSLRTDRFFELVSSRPARLAGALGFTIKAGASTGTRRAALVAVGSAAASHVASTAVSRLIERNRPRRSLWDVKRADDSFPSSHSASAFGLATGLAGIAPTLRAPLFVAAALVGLSRVWLREHYVTDVFGGSLIGVAAGTLVARQIRAPDEPPWP
jgi:membrane-associated phospholipid phosphatase